MAYTGLYNADGQRQVTIVNGSTYTGVMSPDGQYNGVINDGSVLKGLYHPCGAYNVVIVTNSSAPRQAANGSYNIIASSNGYALVGGGTASATPQADLFVFAGQSNAQSVFTTLAGVPAYITSDTNVKMWDYDTSAFVTYGAGTSSLQPTTQVDSGGGTSGNWGAEAEFSYRWRLANPTKKAFIVKYSLGSTRLFATTGNDWSETSATSEYFGRVEAAIVAAKAAIVALGLTPTVRMISWMQGEADAGDVTWDAAYPTNLPNVVTAMRSRWGDANTQVIIGRINPAWAGSPCNVRLAQVTVGNAGPLNKWLNTDGYSLTSNHYNDAGSSQFGKDTFYAYASGHSEKVTNGTFASVTTPWTGQSRNGASGVIAADATVISLSSGTLLVTNSATVNIAVSVQPISGLTVGATYKVSADLTRADNPAKLYVSTDPQGSPEFTGTGATQYTSGSLSAPVAVDGSFVATATTHYISLCNFSFNSSGSVGFDNVSVIGP